MKEIGTGKQLNNTKWDFLTDKGTLGVFNQELHQWELLTEKKEEYIVKDTQIEFYLIGGYPLETVDFIIKHYLRDYIELPLYTGKCANCTNYGALTNTGRCKDCDRAGL